MSLTGRNKNEIKFNFVNLIENEGVMDSVEIKNQIRNYIEHADERVLRLIHAIIESESEDGVLTKEQKNVLDARLAYHTENPEEGKNWTEVREAIKKEYGL